MKTKHREIQFLTPTPPIRPATASPTPRKRPYHTPMQLSLPFHARSPSHFSSQFSAFLLKTAQLAIYQKNMYIFLKKLLTNQSTCAIILSCSGDIPASEIWVWRSW